LESGISGQGRQLGGKNEKEHNKEKMRTPRRNSWDIPRCLKQRKERIARNGEDTTKGQ